MIALPNMTVPAQFQAPPPLPPSGQADGSFSNYLANTPTLNFNAPNSLNGSTAIRTSLSSLKTTAKNDNTNNDGSTAQNQTNPSPPPASPATPAAPTSGAGQTSSTNNGQAPGAGGTGASSTTGAASTAQGQLAAPPSNGTVAALGAQGKTAFTAQFADLIGNTGTQPGSNQTGGVPLPSGTAPVQSAANQAGIAALLAAKGRAGIANATKIAPTGSSLAGRAAASANGQFGVAGATSTVNQSVRNGVAATASQVATAATAATADQSAVQSPATSAAQADASGTKLGADGNPITPGATELNARIVAGATMLAARPSAALTSAAKSLLLPSNPNTAATPANPATVNAPGEKANGDPASNVPVGAIAGTSTSIASAPGTAAADPRAITATLTRPLSLDHDAAPDDAATGTPPVNAATTDLNTALSSSSPANTTPANTPPDASVATANAAAPDIAARQNLMGLPAGEQVALNLRQAIKDGSNDIHIQLKPESLGAIDVKLNVNHDGHLTAVISADRSDTLNLLKQDSGTLQQSLRDAGFNADNGSLSFNLRGDSQSFAQNTAQHGNTSGSTITGGDDSMSVAPVYASRQTSGTIDIQA